MKLIIASTEKYRGRNCNTQNISALNNANTKPANHFTLFGCGTDSKEILTKVLEIIERKD